MSGKKITAESLVAPLNKAFKTIADKFKSLHDKIGNTATLGTENKNSLVDALNEILSIARQGGTGGGISEETVNSKVSAAVNALKAELLGGQVAEELDTLKEIAEKLTHLEGDQTIKAAILAKFAEQNERIGNIETVLKTDFAAIINQQEGVP